MKSVRKPKGESVPKLTDRVALVTGGSRGIGAAIAKRLASDGATVAITWAKDAKGASAVVADIERAGGKALAIQAEATDADALTAAVETAAKTFGRLDILVNNAGTAIPKPFEETTLEEMDRMLGINVRGTFVATQAALRHMTSGGRIIMIGSCVGERNMRRAWRPTRPRRAPSKCSRRALPERPGAGASRSITSSPGPLIPN